jgi:hypothetical protein
MAVTNFFPFSPEYMTWEDWNGNLVMFYGEESIPYWPEENWKQTAKDVCQLPTFLSYPVSDPETFENWQDWASDFTFIINGPTK